MNRLAAVILWPLGVALVLLPNGCAYGSKTSSKTSSESRSRTTTPYAEAKLRGCLPERWTVRKVTADSSKIALAHIGKADFELHFEAQYSVVDTLYARQLNKKPGNTYQPHIILHFYRHSAKVKQQARFVQDNMAIISALAFPQDFGETQDFLVYESTGPVALRSVDAAEVQLRNCLQAKLRE
ncbi:hypothetical protein [Hymenobacter canadensis]|uniref:Lipoprotein n=1 Tax=Hymenobacter canadensis TaxID=2999067 RepID=A0ABY7LP04_9BACT|nr:hypothetical protein [Hymenobacter canadensis]WBA42156.1 hypothetical protein O3303_01050 [Hymenobacter canadensis]